MARSPYHIARQEHLGDMLDRLARKGLLTWEWGYDTLNKRAIYWVTESGRSRTKLDTKRAEELVTRLCQREGIVWLPVPAPGGERQRADTLRRIAELEQGQQFSAVSRIEQLTPIHPISFDIGAYPTLQSLLKDVPTDDRSAQTFHAARTCMELGLNDGRVKWFLARYPPFLDKYGQRSDADRELDRVIFRARETRENT